MLQRPQTLFMLAALLCLLAAYFVPVLAMGAQPVVPFVEVFTHGIRVVLSPENVGMSAEPGRTGYLGLALHLGAVVALAFAMASFKKRPLQIRLLALVNLLAFSALGAAIYSFKFSTDPKESLLTSLSWGTVLLLVATVCNLLAVGRIRKDDNLVRSMHRLR